MGWPRFVSQKRDQCGSEQAAVKDDCRMAAKGTSLSMILMPNSGLRCTLLSCFMKKREFDGFGCANGH